MLTTLESPRWRLRARTKGDVPAMIDLAEADIDPRNAGSLRSVERLGFKLEGRLRERYFLAGEIQDSLICGLLANEWAAR